MACNLPSLKESWLRNKHSGPYALLPICRRHLTSKTGKRLKLPHVIASAKEKKKKQKKKTKPTHPKSTEKFRAKVWGSPQSSPLSACLQGPPLHCHCLCHWLLAWQKRGMGSGSAYATSPVLAVKLRYLHGYFLAQLALHGNDLQSARAPAILLFSSLFTSCPRGRKITHQKDAGEARTSFCHMPVRSAEGERAAYTQYLSFLVGSGR